MDQAALAAKLGLSKSSVSRIMSGSQEPKLLLAHDLAKALGVTLDYLVQEGQEVEPADQLVMVTEDEFTILKIVRRLGVDVSIDRLLKNAQDNLPPENKAPQGETLGRSNHDPDAGASQL
jgi:transcriptional regulator with XRE-family HTH domain